MNIIHITVVVLKKSARKIDEITTLRGVLDLKVPLRCGKNWLTKCVTDGRTDDGRRAIV